MRHLGDLSRAVYRTQSGWQVRLGASDDAAPITMRADSFNGVTTATLATDNPDDYRLDTAVWQVTPSPASYAQQVMIGPHAVFKPAVQPSTVTCTVTTTGGAQRSLTLPVWTGADHRVDTQKHAVVRDITQVPIETTFGFGAAQPGTTAALVRVARPGVPSEETITATRLVDFPAGSGVRLAENVTLTPVTGIGAGWEWRWRLTNPNAWGPGVTIWSDRIPIWSVGPAAPAPSVTTSPRMPTAPMFDREASSYGRVTPAAGRSYADHVTAWVAQWHATVNGGAPMAGAWLNTEQYNSVTYVIDLDDETVPRHRVEFADIRTSGYHGNGWYGLDAGARPWPMDRIAVDVPIPDYAIPAYGTDRQMSIVGTRGGVVEKVWEFWIARRHPDGHWSAESVGQTGPHQDWQLSAAYTSSASGISGTVASLTVSEAARATAYIRAEREAGRQPTEAGVLAIVDHPMCIAIPRPRAGVVSWPATHTDGDLWDDTAPAEGQIMYLRQNVDLGAANLSPLMYVIATLIKRRGLIVTDRTWSTAAISIEGDVAYGPSGATWRDSIMDPGETPEVIFPDGWWEIGPVFADKPAFDAGA